VTRRRPELELGIAVGADLQKRIVAAIVQLDSGQALRVAAVEAFGQPQNRGERLDDATPLARQLAVVFVITLRR